MDMGDRLSNKNELYCTRMLKKFARQQALARETRDVREKRDADRLDFHPASPVPPVWRDKMVFPHPPGSGEAPPCTLLVLRWTDWVSRVEPVRR